MKYTILCFKWKNVLKTSLFVSETNNWYKKYLKKIILSTKTCKTDIFLIIINNIWYTNLGSEKYMKDLLINSVMNNIKRYYNYDEEKLKVIKYGLASLYLHITKMFVIFLVSYILGTLKTLLILMGLYSYLRLTSFGVHAKKSSHCWLI